MTNWFWPFSTQTSVHIKNRIPHMSLPTDFTPFYGWYNKKPDLSHLRPFGALVTARKTDSDQLNKLEPRGEEGRFVGYAKDSRGYLIWFPSSKSVRPRRDIDFHGFPVHLPCPHLSDILWDDLTFDEPPHNFTPELTPEATVPDVTSTTMDHRYVVILNGIL
jgi:hypothetical protein